MTCRPIRFSVGAYECQLMAIYRLYANTCRIAAIVHALVTLHY